MTAAIDQDLARLRDRVRQLAADFGQGMSALRDQASRLDASLLALERDWRKFFGSPP